MHSPPKSFDLFPSFSPPSPPSPTSPTSPTSLPICITNNFHLKLLDLLFSSLLPFSLYLLSSLLSPSPSSSSLSSLLVSCVETVVRGYGQIIDERQKTLFKGKEKNRIVLQGGELKEGELKVGELKEEVSVKFELLVCHKTVCSQLSKLVSNTLLLSLSPNSPLSFPLCERVLSSASSFLKHFKNSSFESFSFPFFPPSLHHSHSPSSTPSLHHSHSPSSTPSLLSSLFLQTLSKLSLPSLFSPSPPLLPLLSSFFLLLSSLHFPLFSSFLLHSLHSLSSSLPLPSPSLLLLKQEARREEEEESRSNLANKFQAICFVFLLISKLSKSLEGKKEYKERKEYREWKEAFFSHLLFFSHPFFLSSPSSPLPLPSPNLFFSSLFLSFFSLSPS